MADDDEVDVLGDFSLDSLFPKEDSRLHCYDASVLGTQSSDLLHDYMAPQWLLDTTQPWYPTEDKPRVTSDRLLPEDRQNTFGFSSLTGVESPTKTVPGTSRWEEQDLGWTDREKSLLEKGMEMFGRSWNKIAQSIGTKTPSQVKNFVKWERNNRTDEGIVVEENVSSSYDQQPGEVFSFSEIIDDMQIPASMEEVIAVVSTASPTIPISLSRIGDNRDRRKEGSKNQAWNGKQVFSKSYLGRKQDQHKDLEERKKRDKKKRVLGNVAEEKMRHTFLKNELTSPKKRDVNVKGSSSKHGKYLVKDTTIKPVGGSKDLPRLPENLSCGEEVIRISREGSESDDSEIEVGDDEPIIMDCKHELVINDLPSKKTIPTNLNAPSTEILEEISTTIEHFTSPSEVVMGKAENEGLKNKECMLSGFDKDISGNKHYNSNIIAAMKDRKDKSSSHQDIMDNIAAIIPPSKEFYPDLQTISEQEKLIHTEFFEGRSTKTPKRYMKIRNHILECWYNSRPQYVTKTSVRTGLRNCGDVNCIGRIHAYLEQIGAINFGCEQARYLRPHVTSSPALNSCPAEGEEQIDLFKGPTREEISARHQARIEAMRPRKRKGMDLRASLEGVDGGYTIIHGGNGDGGEDDDGIVVFVKANQSSRKHNQSNRVTTGHDQSKLKLLRCVQYSDNHPAPFALELCLDALLVVDLHAHLMQSEVAGLLGGYLKNYSEVSSDEKDHNTLRICRAIPCRSSSSNVGCDICPVSQTEALEALEAEGLELVGWYHSHPTFPPLPSVQDIETQMRVQEWFTRSSGAPFLGLILSPHSTLNHSLASSFRCILVENNQEIKQEIPFELGVKVMSLEASGTCLSYLNNVISVINSDSSSNEIDLDSPLKSVLVQSITLRKKILESARILMETSKPHLNYDIQVDIITGLEKLLAQLSSHSAEENDEHH